VRDVAKVPIEIGVACSGRGPVARGERVQIDLIGHPRQAGEHVAQVGERVFAVPLARDNDRENDRRALAGVGVPDKQPVLFFDDGGPYGIFDQVVVQPCFAVIDVRGQRRPVAQQVAGRRSEWSFVRKSSHFFVRS